MLVDYERAWRTLQASLQDKSGHGTFGPDGLLSRMAQIEKNCAVNEGPTERVLRLFGVEVSQDLLTIVEKATGGAPSGTPTSEGLHNDSNGANHDPQQHRTAA